MAKEAVVSRVGMLWYDDQGTLGERLARASRYYARKYGGKATWAQVNNADYKDGEYKVRVEASETILPFHIWIGGDDYNEAD